MIAPSGQTLAQIGLDFSHDSVFEFQRPLNIRVAIHNRQQHRFSVLAGQRAVGAVDQQVCHLGVLLAALAGRRNHHDSTGGIRQHNIAHLLHLAAIRQ